MNSTGIEYIGLYHTIKNGQIWSEGSFNKNSVQLRLYVDTIAGGSSPSAGIYFNLTAAIFDKHLVPVYYYPIPKESDYKAAKFVRFFISKKNDYSTLMEIDIKQFKARNVNNKKGINSDLYIIVELAWSISGPKEDVARANKSSILKASKIIPTLKSYLGDLTEYYKG